MYGCVITDIIETFCRDIGTKVIILGDVTYGACCIDDFTAAKLGADFMIHYGHSCLVPINVTQIPIMYVFVEISFDTSHLIPMVLSQFPEPTTQLCIMGTVQFLSAVYELAAALKSHGYTRVLVPQARPLSSGETLGCTSPLLPYGRNAPAGADPTEPAHVVFVADGRFHLEAAMIRNPDPCVQYLRYDPYNKVFTEERYDVRLMKELRWSAIATARSATVFGLILGTLGRQGSLHIFNRIKGLLQGQDRREGRGQNESCCGGGGCGESSGAACCAATPPLPLAALSASAPVPVPGKRVVIPFLMAELNPSKMARISAVEVWVQVACPRLSIDWGAQSELMSKPLLTPYELEVMLHSGDDASAQAQSDAVLQPPVPPTAQAQVSTKVPASREEFDSGVYSMDFYSDDAGPWGNMYHRKKLLPARK